ncbi:putative translation initiation inhibitor, yjgF family [Terriglobus roseus DSM 18391]|uniref:Putative translation initiation inhibitor, yjgF family n=1 Tax=Terriglobus roseus (strain DSM 18391 / NRRL B-41598 / KBS 63) TaxID=926566 RepID=I3ZCS0_TERRK|nr:RidA family protein [Terriglobus roseus]AFL87038.1 putative translation initiation inhibitor, yjgF family [Terriglobus roseus DSM 18391]
MIKILLGLVLCGASALGSRGAHAQGVIPPTGTAVTPFSSVIRMGDTVYVSGSVGADRATGKPPADAAVEAAKMLDSVKTLLTKEGMTMDDLVTVTIFCTDMNLYATFNKVYITYFHQPFPARAFIGAKELVLGAHFEIMGVAQKGAAATKTAGTK